MEPFDAFLRDCRVDLMRIARHSSGEHEYGDVCNEALEMADILAARQGKKPDFSDPVFRKTLLSHLYQKLVRYQECTVRYAVRLDHAPPGSDEPDAPHPLLNSLASGDEPLAALLAVTSIVAIIMNYVKKDDVAGTFLESHFRWQIRTFWFALLWSVIGLLTAAFMVGWLVLVANAVWFIYRIVKGFLNLNDSKPMYVA